MKNSSTWSHVRVRGWLVTLRIRNTEIQKSKPDYYDIVTDLIKLT